MAQTRTILFPVTYACNLNCAFCCVKGRRAIDIDIPKSLEQIKDRKSDIDWVYITGGEPLLIPELPKICQELREAGFKVGVTTNGTIFRPEIADVVDRIGISLDGDQEYHNTYRGEGVYNKAIQFLQKIKGKCETVVMSVVFEENIEALRRLKSAVEELDPTYWQIQRDLNDASIVIPEDL